MSWIKAGPVVAFDTETSGVNVTEGRIVTAAFIRLVPGQQPERHTFVLNPGVEIPEAAAAIHGYTTERAIREGSDPEPALAEISQLLGDAFLAGEPVIAFNAAFDLSLLAHELVRYGLPAPGAAWPVRPVIDPLCIDKHIDRFRPGSRKLVDACEHYNVALDGAHDAAADALAAARVAWKQATSPAPCRQRDRSPCDHADIGDLTLDALHDLQVLWAKEQAEGLAAYFERQGKDASDVDGSWPLRAVA